jgi:hypothetical protein
MEIPFVVSEIFLWFYWLVAKTFLEERESFFRFNVYVLLEGGEWVRKEIELLLYR